MPALNASEAMQNEIIAAQPADAALHEGAAYHAATPENPLHRTVVVSIHSSLNELCLQKSRGNWQPSQEALKSICKPRTSSSAYPSHEASFSPHSHTLAMAVQQKKYTALDGSAEVQGDLKVQSRTRPLLTRAVCTWLAKLIPPRPCAQSMVLHDLQVSHVKSSFPICKPLPAAHNCRRAARRCFHARALPTSAAFLPLLVVQRWARVSRALTTRPTLQPAKPSRT